MSNRERIARAAEEARLEEAENAEKKAAKASARPRSKQAAQAIRMKIVWEVCSSSGKVVKTFPYPGSARRRWRWSNALGVSGAGSSGTPVARLTWLTSRR